MTWYLQSPKDNDTHRGTMNRGMVNADCGIQFAPRLVAFGRKALPGPPPDPEQTCSACARPGSAR
ncbi:MAG: hypothetical protein ACRDRY_11775 [Pseudonocardiaceae bacterium]